MTTKKTSTGSKKSRSGTRKSKTSSRASSSPAKATKTKAKRKTASSVSRTSTKTKARAAKKTPARKAAKRAEPRKQAPTAAKKAAAKPAASKRVAKKTPQKKNTVKAAPPPKKRFRWPNKDELLELPTEEVWALYRKAGGLGSKGKDRLELLRNALMELHYPLVRHIAERLLQTLPKSIELEDLVSAGLFGLMDAIRGFDHERGIKFKTYCTTRIRGSILDQLRSQDWVPRLVRLKAGKIEKALHRLQGEYGREPTHAELASTLEMGHAELAQEMTSAHAKTMFSLSDKWEDQDESSSMEKVEVLEDDTAEDPLGEINCRDVMNFITRSLTHKERFIIEQYYQVGHTMREIGEMLALTESRVCQIHSNVMGRLKGILGPKAGVLTI